MSTGPSATSITQQIETSIVERLTLALTLPGMHHPKVEVQAWPERARDYKMQHPHGTVLVLYQRTRYETLGTSGHWASGTAQFEIAVAARTLREPQGPGSAEAGKGLSAYALIDTCKWALSAWRPDAAARPAALDEDGFSEYHEGLWCYSLSVGVPVLVMTGRACVPGPWVDECCLDAPLLQQLDFSAGRKP